MRVGSSFDTFKANVEFAKKYRHKTFRCTNPKCLPQEGKRVIETDTHGKHYCLFCKKEMKELIGKID